MRDLSKPYRLAIYAVLNGNITIPLFDEKKKVGNTEKFFAVFSTQRQTSAEQNDCTWMSNCSIDIEIIQKTGFEVTKDDIDDVSNLICELLIPSQGITPVTMINGQVTNPEINEITSRNVSISDSETIIQKIITFSCLVIQQTT